MTGARAAQKVRAVIDSNIFVRAVLSEAGGAALIWRYLKERRFVPIASRYQLREIHRALGYPRIADKYGVTDAVRRRLVAQLYTRSLIVSPSSAPTVCRDPNDDYLVANALLGSARYLATEDKAFSTTRRS